MTIVKPNSTFSEKGGSQAANQEISRVVIFKRASNDIDDLMEQYAHANPKSARYEFKHGLPTRNGVEIDIAQTPITFSEELGDNLLVMVNHKTIYIAGQEMQLGYDGGTGRIEFSPKRDHERFRQNLKSITSRFGL